ncbi:MAG TPA: glutathione S-transferase family protein [Burkholderiaceae bacterium]|nr:glutathione S-transferase family protein [Burkholderiaceae bacterium]
MADLILPDLILHHYATSPFSEKVRLVLGHKRLAWRSVVVPMLMPKPDVLALTGGYRRTPFLQVGADVYCDSALICRLLDRLQPEPPLYPHTAPGIAEIVAQWADASLFWAAVPYAMRAGGAPHIMAKAEPQHDNGLPLPERMKAFGADRAAMMGATRVPGPADLKNALLDYLARVEGMLADGRPFLLGALVSIADFSVAQSVWFLRLAPPVAQELLAPFPKVVAWHDRVAAPGYGRSEAMSSDQALRVAAQATAAHAPTEFDATQGFALGDEVGVMPLDYAHDTSVGRLIGLTHDEVVIARADPRAGTLHVHFPRIGFQVKKTAPAA